MKKILTMATTGLVLGMLMISVTAKAVLPDANRKLYNGICPDGVTVIKVCGDGTDTCTPSGSC